MTTTSVTPGGCGARNRASVCTLPAGHPGPHEAHGYGDRLIEEWVQPIETDQVAVVGAIAAAEATAYAAHQAGTCQDSEWSCTHCELAAVAS